jgi:hypothetical protein
MAELALRGRDPAVRGVAEVLPPGAVGGTWPATADARSLLRLGNRPFSHSVPDRPNGPHQPRNGGGAQE